MGLAECTIYDMLGWSPDEDGEMVEFTTTDTTYTIMPYIRWSDLFGRKKGE